jgi:histidine phosphotransferase ChpT
MHQDQTSLAALIGSRICHDLISPIGAISNGLELVSLSTPAPASPEMTLIQQSCDNAAARIRFFRIAFGSAGDRRPVPASEAGMTLQQHFAGTRIAPEWRMTTDLPRSTVQLAYLSVLCAESALPQGGAIAVSRDDRGVRIAATGPRVCCEDALWQRLTKTSQGAPCDLRPAHVQFGLLAALTQEAGCGPTVTHDDTMLEVHLPLSRQSA